MSHSSALPEQQETSLFIPSQPVATLDEAYAYCRRVTRDSSSNFYYAFCLLSKAQHDALCATYAFCRFMDDITDQPTEPLRAEDGMLGDEASNGDAGHSGQGQQDKLDKLDKPGKLDKLTRLLNLWREELDYCYAQKPRHPISQALADTVQRFPIKREHLVGIIDGVEMDLHRTRYQTFAELHDYCYHVACLVGLVCIEIFGYRNPQTQDYAVNLGLALQLTNILRDVGEDAQRDRIYLPAEDLAMCGYTEQELGTGVYNEAFLRLMRFEEERARQYYRQAEENLAREDRRSLASAEAMHFIYRRLLDEIVARQFRVFETRVALSTSCKIRLALYAWGRSHFIS